MPPPEGRGKTFSSKKGKIAPDALKEALEPVKHSIKPTAVVAKEMFAAPKGKNIKAVPKPKAATPMPKAATPMPKVKPIVVKSNEPEGVEKEAEPEAEPEPDAET